MRHSREGKVVLTLPASDIRPGPLLCARMLAGQPASRSMTTREDYREVGNDDTDRGVGPGECESDQQQHQSEACVHDRLYATFRQECHARHADRDLTVMSVPTLPVSGQTRWMARAVCRRQVHGCPRCTGGSRRCAAVFRDGTSAFAACRIRPSPSGPRQEGRQASGTRGGSAVGGPAPPAGMVPSLRAPHVGQLTVECGLRGFVGTAPKQKRHACGHQYQRPRLWQACDTVNPGQVWVNRLTT